jgi:Flp pilus assembly CpaF family ATPase
MGELTRCSLDAKHPLAQARVLDGTTRLTAAIPPIADRLSATVRRYTLRDASLESLVERDALTEDAAAFMWAMMQLRSRIAISSEPARGHDDTGGGAAFCGSGGALRAEL